MATHAYFNVYSLRNYFSDLIITLLFNPLKFNHYSRNCFEFNLIFPHPDGFSITHNKFYFSRHFVEKFSLIL